MAPERLAKAAVGARWPSLISLRNDRPRRRERMIAKLPRRAVEDLTGLIDTQRRQRIVASPWCLKRIAAIDLASLQVTRFTRHTEFKFGAIIVRLEIFIPQRPLG